MKKIAKEFYFRVFGIKNDIQLISMHIPKTAGTSFRNTLKDIYGNKLGLVYENKWPHESRGYEVIHGHFYLERMLNEFPDAQVITWVRNPMDRIISLYQFWKVLPDIKNDLQIDIKSGKLDLVEFSRIDGIGNEMTKYFSDISLERFLFIGVVEDYSNDLNELGGILKWSSWNENIQNINNRKRNVIDSKIINEVNTNLKADNKLYNEILKFRKK